MKISHESGITSVVLSSGKELSGLPFDVVLAYVMLQLGIIKKITLLRAVGIEPSSVSRLHKLSLAVPARWYLRLHEYSGIPIADLREIANDRSDITPHENSK